MTTTEQSTPRELPELLPKELDRCEHMLTNCVCIPDFKDRNLTDPQCEACNLGAEVIDSFRALRRENAELATRLAESEASADARLLQAWDDARNSGINWNLHTGEDFINYVLARCAAIDAAQEAEREAGSA